MSTIAIQHPDDPNRPTVIPADQYDAEVHVLWNEHEAPSLIPEPAAEVEPEDEADMEDADEADEDFSWDDYEVEDDG